MATEPKIFYTTFSVDGDAQTITLTGGGEIRASSKHYFKARFAFVDGDSNAFLRLDHLTATFSPVPAERSRNGAYSVPLEETEGVYECEIPWEVLTRRGNVYVGVFAGDMLVTNEATIRVTKAAPVLGSHSQPTESWWSRFSAALAAAVASLTARINTKQDALIAGENITIDDNVISAQGGASVTPYDEHPQMDGAASAGGSTKYARGDHRHPTDTALAGRIATIEGKEGGWNAKWGSGTIGAIPITALEATAQILIMRGSQAGADAASALAGLENKVDKVTGKELSTNDYDSAAKAKVDAIPANPQYTDTTYTAGTGISISDQNVISATGGGGSANAVLYTEQSLTAAQQTQARANIDAYSATDAAAAAQQVAAAIASKQDELTFDQTPTAGSDNPVTSGGVYDAIPTATSDLTNDSGFITGSDIPTIPSASSATPQALGTAAAGSSLDYSRADHVHAKPTAADVGAIATPASPATGAFLVWNGTAWTAQTLATWQGGNY